LVTAVVQASQPGDKGPNSLTIRCHAKRTELSLQFRGDPTSSKAGNQQIYFQIGSQSPTEPDWSWSPDGRTATLKADAVSLLQLLPDDANLRIWTGNTGDAPQGATFQLFGLNAVKRKVASACHWSAQQAQTPSKRR
jgi:hypothetical protein